MRFEDTHGTKDLLRIIQYLNYSPAEVPTVTQAMRTLEQVSSDFVEEARQLLDKLDSISEAISSEMENANYARSYAFCQEFFHCLHNRHLIPKDYIGHPFRERCISFSSVNNAFDYISIFISLNFLMLFLSYMTFKNHLVESFGQFLPYHKGIELLKNPVCVFYSFLEIWISSFPSIKGSTSNPGSLPTYFVTSRLSNSGIHPFRNVRIIFSRSSCFLFCQWVFPR